MSFACDFRQSQDEHRRPVSRTGDEGTGRLEHARPLEAVARRVGGLLRGRNRESLVEHRGRLTEARQDLPPEPERGSLVALPSAPPGYPKAPLATHLRQGLQEAGLADASLACDQDATTEPSLRPSQRLFENTQLVSAGEKG